jgi:hypothetical protein
MAKLMKKPLVAIFSISLLLVIGVVYSAHHPVKPLPNDLSHTKQIRAAAEQGDSESQTQLGLLYEVAVALGATFHFFSLL